MSDDNSNLLPLIRALLHEFSYELDANYENDTIGILADEDSTFLTFRRAIEVLREKGVRLSKRTIHVEQRIEAAYREAFNEPLPGLDNGPGTDKIY